MKIKALKDWIVLKKKKEKSKSRIILNVKSSSQMGIVICLGKKLKNKIDINDCLIYKKYSDIRLKIDNKEYIFVKYKNIIAKVI
ncbi:hypothetical protein ACWNYO_00580 [Candidatus Vidania fulgoroideorum]